MESPYDAVRLTEEGQVAEKKKEEEEREEGRKNNVL